MNKFLLLIIALMGAFTTSAQVSVSGTERRQIIDDVVNELGHFDAVEVERRARLAALEYPMPFVYGKTQASGSCAAYPCDLPVAFAGTQSDNPEVPDITGIKGIKDGNGAYFQKFSPKLSSTDFNAMGTTDVLLGYELFVTWNPDDQVGNDGEYEIFYIEPDHG